MITFSCLSIDHLDWPNTFSCDSTIFHSGPRKFLKKGLQGKCVPAIPSLKQAALDLVSSGRNYSGGKCDLCPRGLVLTWRIGIWCCTEQVHPTERMRKKRSVHFKHLLTKHAREELRQRPFFNTGSFDTYPIEEDIKKALILGHIDMTWNTALIW